MPRISDWVVVTACSVILAPVAPLVAQVLPAVTFEVASVRPNPSRSVLLADGRLASGANISSNN